MKIPTIYLAKQSESGNLDLFKNKGHDNTPASRRSNTKYS